MQIPACFLPKREGAPYVTLVARGVRGVSEDVSSEVSGLTEFGENIHRKTGAMNRFVENIGVRMVIAVILGVDVALALLSPVDYGFTLFTLLLVETVLFKAMGYIHGTLTYVKEATLSDQ